MFPMCSRRIAAAALGWLFLLPVFAACGEDTSSVDVGDLVAAREDSQFSDGAPSSLVLPIGRLEVFLGEPTARLDARHTRQLEPATAPPGSTFVPITWQYDAGTFGDHAAYLGEAPTPKVELRADRAGYRLPAPDSTGQGGESFYVLVSGSGRDLDLAVTYDGVEQSVDLLTGERDPGDAAGLYDLTPATTKTRACEKGADFNGTAGYPDYRCRYSRPVRLPYADGAWAEPGRTFLALTVTTSIRRFDIAGDVPGSGALYLPASVTSTFALGEIEPIAAVQDTTDTCPDLANGGCTGRYDLVFDVPAREKRFRLTMEQTFALVLGSRWGGYDGDETMDLDVSVTIDLK